MKPWLSMCLALLLVAGCADEPTEREPQVLEVGPPNPIAVGAFTVLIG